MPNKTEVAPRPLEAIVDDLDAISELKRAARTREERVYLAIEKKKTLGDRALAVELTRDRVATLREQLAREDQAVHEDWRLPKE